MLVSHTAIEPTKNSIDASELTLEDENTRLAIALSQKFEETNVIRDFTEQLKLESDAAETCQILLELLEPCLESISVSIDLFADPDRGTPSAMHQLGVGLSEGKIRDIAASAKEFVRSVTGAEIYSGATIANHSDLPRIRDLRVIVMPIAHAGHNFGELVGIRDGEDEEFGTIEADLLKSTLTTLGVQLTNQRQYQEMQEMFEGTVNSLVSALDAKDNYTCGHSSRVSELSVYLADGVGMSAEKQAEIRMGGILHDIGKIGVDDAVLRKPGRLSDDEFDQIKQHPVLGYEILKGIRPFRDLLPMVMHHHESWDGTGYPDGLAGKEIPREAQIVAVADAFDAMTSDRPYRDGMPLERVIKIFKEGRDVQWPADLVDLLLSDLDRLEEFAQHGMRRTDRPAG